MRGENRPPNDGRSWISTEEAAKRLDLGTPYFRGVARRWQLTSFRPKDRTHHQWFLQEEIESLAQFRAHRKWFRRKHSRFSGERQTEKIDRETAQRIFITTEQAMEILGVNRSVIHDYVNFGRLYSYQQQPGKKGSPLWFSRRAVLQLRDDPKRLRWHDVWLKGAAQREARRHEQSAQIAGFAPESPVTPMFGDGWLTTREAARRLGISPGRMRDLYRTGHVLGEYRATPRLRRPHLHYRVEHIEALLSDPMYLKEREKYQRANRYGG